MMITLAYQNRQYSANLAAPIDISIALLHGNNNPNCFYAPPPLFQPVRAEGFVGSTQEGGAVNFYNIHLNPHGNGTHTECVGHIAKENYTINRCLQNFHSIGRLITVTPEVQGEDRVITKEALLHPLHPFNPSDGYNPSDGLDITSLIIRTLPNGSDKLNRQYTATNPPYISDDAMQYIVDAGVTHLLVDLPSVDREVDGGQLAAHHIFWNYPAQTRTQATITEMIYVADAVQDGLYLVNHQIMSIELDASPSKITIYPLLQA